MITPKSTFLQIIYGCWKKTSLKIQINLFTALRKFIHLLRLNAGDHYVIYRRESVVYCNKHYYMCDTFEQNATLSDIKNRRDTNNFLGRESVLPREIDLYPHFARLGKCCLTLRCLTLRGVSPSGLRQHFSTVISHQVYDEVMSLPIAYRYYGERSHRCTLYN